MRLKIQCDGESWKFLRIKQGQDGGENVELNDRCISQDVGASSVERIFSRRALDTQDVIQRIIRFVSVEIKKTEET
jgi:hypothetical protein